MNACTPLAAHLVISRPRAGMSDAAKRLLFLQTWLEVCLTDKRLDAEAYLTQCRIREQAAYIIGCGL